MNKNIVGPIILIALGFFILFHNFIRINFLYFLIPFISTIILLYLFKNNVKLHINEFMIKQGIFHIKYENKHIYGIIMKIMGKLGPNENREDIEKELKEFINAITRKDSEFKFLILTTIEKNKLGSSIVIYRVSEREYSSSDFNMLLSEVNNIMILANAIAPHIELKIIYPSSNVLPIPSSFGNYPFLSVSEITYDSPVNVNIIGENYDIELGEATNGIVKTKIGIRLEDVTRHIGIFGSTGSGKTNTSMILATQLSAKGVKVIILDWHGEYAKILNNNNFIIYNNLNKLRINPLYLVDLNIEDTIDIIGDVLQLTDPQRFLLYTILLSLKNSKRFSFNQFLEVLNNIEDTSYWMRDVKYALLRKIFVLFTDVASELFYDDKISISKFLDYFSKSTIIDLSFLTNLKLRKLYALFILKLITESYVRLKVNERTLIILDEAQNYFNKEGNDFIDRIVTEIRKYNIGLCFITQSPSLISQTVLKNTNIKIIHSIKSDVDKKAIKDSLSLDERLTRILDKLDVGEAIISAPNLKMPIIVKIKKIF